MNIILMILLLLFLRDYFKDPIDNLYFQNPWRIFVGMRNTLYDIVSYKKEYNVDEYDGLYKIRENFSMIKKEFDKLSHDCPKTFMHELDEFLPKNPGYYALYCKNFPETFKLLESIPCVDMEITHFLVIEGPLYLCPHRAESNHLLRYQMTLYGTEHSFIEVETGQRLYHLPGQEFLFDHSRKHALSKHDKEKRVVLCLNIKRF